MSHIKRILLTLAKGVCEPVASGELRTDYGLVGDRFAGRPGNKQLSLLMGERAEDIRAANGLCTTKFHANLITEGIDFSRLSVGAKIQAGECLLEITQIGKPCFPDDCVIRQRGEICPLPSSVGYARILMGGTISEGDCLTIL